MWKGQKLNRVLKWSNIKVWCGFKKQNWGNCIIYSDRSSVIHNVSVQVFDWMIRLPSLFYKTFEQSSHSSPSHSAVCCQHAAERMHVWQTHTHTLFLASGQKCVCPNAVKEKPVFGTTLRLFCWEPNLCVFVCVCRKVTWRLPLGRWAVGTVSTRAHKKTKVSAAQRRHARVVKQNFLRRFLCVLLLCSDGRGQQRAFDQNHC